MGPAQVPGAPGWLSPGTTRTNRRAVGIWAIEFAKQHPGSRVIGTDLSLIQPDMDGVVPNVEFVREDAEELWVHDEPFDFIHSREPFPSPITATRR